MRYLSLPKDHIYKFSASPNILFVLVIIVKVVLPKLLCKQTVICITKNNLSLVNPTFGFYRKSDNFVSGLVPEWVCWAVSRVRLSAPTSPPPNPHPTITIFQPHPPHPSTWNPRPYFKGRYSQYNHCKQTFHLMKLWLYFTEPWLKCFHVLTRLLDFHFLSPPAYLLCEVYLEARFNKNKSIVNIDTRIWQNIRQIKKFLLLANDTAEVIEGTLFSQPLTK